MRFTSSLLSLFLSFFILLHSPLISSTKTQGFYAGNSSRAQFTNIQSAIEAAHAAGGGLVKIEPGLYIENLKLYSEVDLWGEVGIADTKTCVIQGTHTPPSSGSITIRNIFLESKGDIIKSEEAGTTTIILVDCAMSVYDGYTFNIPNWRGTITGFDLGEIGSINNGGIFNLGGASIFLTNLTMGSGTKNPMVLSGPLEIFGCVIKPVIEFRNNAYGLIGGASFFHNTLILLDDAALENYGSVIVSRENPGIIHKSRSNNILVNIIIHSSAEFAIENKGSGILELTGTVFVDCDKIQSVKNSNSKIDEKKE